MRPFFWYCGLIINLEYLSQKHFYMVRNNIICCLSHYNFEFFVLFRQLNPNWNRYVNQHTVKCHKFSDRGLNFQRSSKRKDGRYYEFLLFPGIKNFYIFYLTIKIINYTRKQTTMSEANIRNRSRNLSINIRDNIK